RHISSGAFPDANEHLLRDVFYIRIAAEHAGNSPRHQSLMLLNKLLERSGIAATDQAHQTQVVSVAFRSPSISFLVARHCSFRRSYWAKLGRKMETGEKSRCRTQPTVFVASRKRPVHAWPAIYHGYAHELPAYSERTQADRSKSLGASAHFRGRRSRFVSVE